MSSYRKYRTVAPSCAVVAAGLMRRVTRMTRIKTTCVHLVSQCSACSSGALFVMSLQVCSVVVFLMSLVGSGSASGWIGSSCHSNKASNLRSLTWIAALAEVETKRSPPPPACPKARDLPKCCREAYFAYASAFSLDPGDSLIRAAFDRVSRRWAERRFNPWHRSSTSQFTSTTRRNSRLAS